MQLPQTDGNVSRPAARLGGPFGLTDPYATRSHPRMNTIAAERAAAATIRPRRSSRAKVASSRSRVPRSPVAVIRSAAQHTDLGKRNDAAMAEPRRAMVTLG